MHVKNAIAALLCTFLLFSGCAQSEPVHVEVKPGTGTLAAILDKASKPGVRLQDVIEENWQQYTANDSLRERLAEIVEDETAPFQDRLEAAAVYCELERQASYAAYRELMGESDQRPKSLTVYSAFLASFPESAQYAAQVLEHVAVDPEEFWHTVQASKVFDYRCAELLCAAASPDLSQEAVYALTQAPDTIQSNISETMDESVCRLLAAHPEYLFDLAQPLFEDGYFRRQGVFTRVYPIFAEPESFASLEDAVRYASFFYDILLPMLQHDFPTQTEGWLGNGYKDGKNVLILDAFRVPFDAEGFGANFSYDEDAKAVEIEDGKILVVGVRPQTDSLAQQQVVVEVIADYMQQLPQEYIPQSLDEVDYVFFLPTTYAPMGYYDIISGPQLRSQGLNMYVNPEVIERSNVKAMASYTMIELYDWRSGEHLGNYGMLEKSPKRSVQLEEGINAIYPDPPSPEAFYRQIQRYIGR